MQALQLWKTIASDEANMLESLVGSLEEHRVACFTRILEAHAGLRSSVPEEVLAWLMS